MMIRYDIVLMLLFFFLQSCSNEDIQRNFIEKKIEISFEGDSNEVFPWVYFSANTENQSTLYIIKNNDTIISQKGTYSFTGGKMPKECNLVLYSRSVYPEWIHIGVTYRKRMSNPLNIDNLKVVIKGYKDNIQYLDTTHIMPAFNIKDELKSSDYVFTLKF